MSSSSGKTNASAAQVRDHFRRNASAFDALYDEDGFLQRRVRPGLGRRRALALEAVGSYPSPSVLDVGCGSGRIAEDVLEHGASRYVGVDFSEPMLELAGRRLERFGATVSLVQGDFLEAGDFQSLSMFDRRNVIARFEQAGLGAGVEPCHAATKQLYM